jgi:hypothetical protein
LKISRRNHPDQPGKFTYFDHDFKHRRNFVWDDAGIDEKGRLFLLEVESSGIVPLHIEGHLARLKVMMVKGETIGGVIWIIKARDFAYLRELLRFYQLYLSPLPQMEIWSTKGVRLGSLPEHAFKT